jgi:hypothetical protein
LITKAPFPTFSNTSTQQSGKQARSLPATRQASDSGAGKIIFQSSVLTNTHTARSPISHSIEIDVLDNINTFVVFCHWMIKYIVKIICS